jgi:hypothetical protein
MTVNAIGADDANYYVNSETDYRDQRNLTLRLPRNRVAAVLEHLHVDALEKLRGHRIDFEAIAQRTRIDFSAGGQPTGKYYYQTQATLTALDRIEDLGLAPAAM